MKKLSIALRMKSSNLGLWRQCVHGLVPLKVRVATTMFIVRLIRLSRNSTTQDVLVFPQSSLIEHYSILSIAEQTTWPVYHTWFYSMWLMSHWLTIKHVFLVVRNSRDTRINSETWRFNLKRTVTIMICFYRMERSKYKSYIIPTEWLLNLCWEEKRRKKKTKTFLKFNRFC